MHVLAHTHTHTAAIIFFTPPLWCESSTIKRGVILILLWEIIAFLFKDETLVLLFVVCRVVSHGSAAAMRFTHDPEFNNVQV